MFEKPALWLSPEFLENLGRKVVLVFSGWIVWVILVVSARKNVGCLNEGHWINRWYMYRDRLHTMTDYGPGRECDCLPWMAKPLNSNTTVGGNKDDNYAVYYVVSLCPLFNLHSWDLAFALYHNSLEEVLFKIKLVSRWNIEGYFLHFLDVLKKQLYLKGTWSKETSLGQFGLAVRHKTGKQGVLSSNPLRLSFLFKNCGLWTLLCDFVSHN